MAKLNENFEFKQDGKTYNLYDLPAGLVIKGDVDLSGKGLTEFPDLSDVIVEGSFDCEDNQLTTLEGAPQKVGGSFNCAGNQLTTLEGAPQKVGGDFYCHNNQLTSLEGSPIEIGGNFYCHNNQLTSLEGAPQKVDGYFDCSLNQLTSLFKLPQMKEDKIIYCDNALGQEYGFSDSSNSGINPRDLLKSSRYQNEVKIDELRQKKHQEDIEKRETVRKNTQAAFDAWLKKNNINPPEK